MAGLAVTRGHAHAKDHGYPVRATVASFGVPVRDAELYDQAVRGFERREETYDASWWLVRHSAISPRDLDQARAALQSRWAGQDAYAEWFKREHGYPLDAVKLGGDADGVRANPFPEWPAVIDRRTGPMPFLEDPRTVPELGAGD
ncbi:hypothetical protein [Yinghuangia seranimata]|uniref:hypothetical protein n=1 Tax=Yinghuangia seranimata TaxID=408067 RepID=UPI00248CFAB2|nr:hypothetical protein [Yinghuangia seranimata]MDI2127806.1 hypothetical protein [Yinghuangia seranimata]